MGKTVSRPSPRGEADWSAFFVPLGVTAAVIVGAMIFFWLSDPDPVDRPTVERLDLREVEPAVETPRSRSPDEPQADERGKFGEDAAVRAAVARDAPSVDDVVPSGVAPAPQELEDEDEDLIDGRGERTPEERQAARERLSRVTSKVPFLAPMLDRVRKRRAGVTDGAPAEGEETGIGATTNGEVTEVPADRLGNSVAEGAEVEQTDAVTMGSAGAAAQ
jgi:hypothetical protein